MLHVVVLFADHVDMRLQDNGLAVFHTRSGGLLDQYVAHFVRQGFQVVLFTEFLQVGHDLLFVFGRARHLADFLEIVENAGRFQIFLFHMISFLYEMLLRVLADLSV